MVWRDGTLKSIWDNNVSESIKPFINLVWNVILAVIISYVRNTWIINRACLREIKMYWV